MSPTHARQPNEEETSRCGAEGPATWLRIETTCPDCIRLMQKSDRNKGFPDETHLYPFGATP